MLMSLLDWYKQADATQFQQGVLWYAHARNTAEVLADAYDTDVETVIGLMSVFSVRAHWKRTLKLTVKALKAGKITGGVVWFTVNHANRILKGEHPLDVMHPDRTPKIWSFYHNIKSGGHDNHVTADVWIARAAHGRDFVNKGLRGEAYEQIADAIREGAEITGLTAPQFQAVVWIAIRGRHD